MFFILSELIYCGQKFRDDRSLESYGIRNGSIVHVLKRSDPVEQESKPGNYRDPEMRFGVLQLYLSDPALVIVLGGST